MPLVDYRELSSTAKGESSADIQARVEAARDRQRERFQSDAAKRDERVQTAHTNAYLGPRMIGKYCALDSEGQSFLEHAMTQLNFSARAHDRILKVCGRLPTSLSRRTSNPRTCLKLFNSAHCFASSGEPIEEKDEVSQDMRLEAI